MMQKTFLCRKLSIALMVNSDINHTRNFYNSVVNGI